MGDPVVFGFGVPEPLALWALGVASDRLSAEGRIGLLAVVAGIPVTGSGLAGADIDLDRTAAIAWPPPGAVHVLAAVAAVISISTASSLTGHQLNPVPQFARDAVGMGGLVALGAAGTGIGASLAWAAPQTWTLLALTFLAWQSPDQATYHQVLTWMANRGSPPPPLSPPSSSASPALSLRDPRPPFVSAR